MRARFEEGSLRGGGAATALARAHEQLSHDYDYYYPDQTIFLQAEAECCGKPNSLECQSRFLMIMTVVSLPIIFQAWHS